MPHPLTRLEWALFLAALGYRIFPIVANGKRPALKRWHFRATTRTDVITLWWEQNPNYNIGIAAGRADGATTGRYLVIVDYDQGEGKRGAETRAKHELLGYLDTYRVKTPHGEHAYYWAETDIRNSVGRIAPHVDVRGHHGYVVGPGSVVDGVEYQWIADSASEPAELPDQIAHAAAQVTLTVGSNVIDLPSDWIDSPQAEARVKQWLVNDAPSAIEGQGGDRTTFLVARRVRALGLTLEPAYLAMLNWWNDDKADPPWEPDELRKKVEHAFTYARDVVGNANPDIEFEDGEGIDEIKAARERLRQARAGGAGALAGGLIDYRHWDGETIPEVPEAYPGAPLRQVGLLGGEGGEGKSTIEMMRNACHALGRDWYGLPVVKRPSLYLGAEDDLLILQRRVMFIARYYGVKPSELYAGGMAILAAGDFKVPPMLCVADSNGVLRTTKLYDRVMEYCGDVKPVNLTLDPLSHIFAGNEIDRVQVYAFIHFMRAIARVMNGTVTLLGHPSLQGIKSGTGLSGSTAWHAAVRFRAYIRKPKRKDEGDDDEGSGGSGGRTRDDGLRVLEFHKNQYGAIGNVIDLQFWRGVFRPLSEQSREARAKMIEGIFVDLVRRFAEENRNVSMNRRAGNWAPAAFVREMEAVGVKATKGELETAMRELVRVKRIKNLPYRDKYRRAIDRLIVAEDHEDNRSDNPLE